jgi:hypothetical protein
MYKLQTAKVLGIRVKRNARGKKIRTVNTAQAAFSKTNRFKSVQCTRSIQVQASQLPIGRCSIVAARAVDIMSFCA